MSSPPNGTARNRHAARILVVEDDPELQRLYRTSLSVAGFDVICARDGIEALHRLDEELPDLVILDLGLPLVSGRDIHREICESTRTRHVPILVVTGDVGDLVESANVCILRKPVDPAALSDAVDSCLRRMNPSWRERP